MENNADWKQYLHDNFGWGDYGNYDGSGEWFNSEKQLEDLEKFIQNLLDEKDKAALRNISFLRQWLNEDRITDTKRMVTNEQIEHWLTLHNSMIQS